MSNSVRNEAGMWWKVSVYSYRDHCPSLFPFPERAIPKAQGRNFSVLTFYNTTIFRDYLGIYFKAVFSFWHLEEVSYLHVFNILTGNSVL